MAPMYTTRAAARADWQQVATTIDPRMLDQIDRLAAADGSSRAVVLRRAISYYLQELEQARNASGSPAAAQRGPANP